MPYVDPVECLSFPHRRRIYEEILRHPGRLQADLERTSGLAKTTVLWHVQKLEHARLIVSENYHGSRVYHAVSNGLPGKRLGRAVALFQDPRNRRVIELANEGHDGATIQRLLRADPQRIAAILDALDIADQRGPDLFWGLVSGFPGLHKVPSMA